MGEVSLRDEVGGCAEVGPDRFDRARLPKASKKVGRLSCGWPRSPGFCEAVAPDLSAAAVVFAQRSGHAGGPEVGFVPFEIRLTESVIALGLFLRRCTSHYALLAGWSRHGRGFSRGLLGHDVDHESPGGGGALIAPPVADAAALEGGLPGADHLGGESGAAVLGHLPL